MNVAGGLGTVISIRITMLERARIRRSERRRSGTSWPILGRWDEMVAGKCVTKEPFGVKSPTVVLQLFVAACIPPAACVIVIVAPRRTALTGATFLKTKQ